MTVLIVEDDPELGELWKHHIERHGHPVARAEDQQAAIRVLQSQTVRAAVIDIGLRNGSVLAIADFASYRFPRINILFVSSSARFSDGSIFNLSANACAYVAADTAPEDLALMVDHYAGKKPRCSLSGPVHEDSQDPAPA